VTSIIKRLIALLPFPTLPTGAPSGHCSEVCENGATSEKSSSRHFGE
jgi:hypothetical protein